MKITHMVNLQHIMDQEGFLGQAAYTESQVRPPPAFRVDCLQPSQAKLHVGAGCCCKTKSRWFVTGNA